MIEFWTIPFFFIFRFRGCGFKQPRLCFESKMKPLRDASEVQTLSLIFCFKFFCGQPHTQPSTGREGSDCKCETAVDPSLKTCLCCCTSVPPGISQNFNTFIIQSNNRHFIFRGRIREEGEWFNGEGLFSCRIVHTTPPGNFTLHNSVAAIICVLKCPTEYLFPLYQFCLPYSRCTDGLKGKGACMHCQTNSHWV